MATQFRVVTKAEAHKLIDDVPGDMVMILTLDKLIGISDNGRYIKKHKGKRIINKASTITLSTSFPIATLDLCNLKDLFGRIDGRISKSILLADIKFNHLE